MTQPKFAPILECDEVRATMRLPIPPPWRLHRPAELAPAPAPAHRPHTGSPGPDQGYALHLAERFGPALLLTEGEHADDVLAGATAIALRRASIFGRAPVSADLRLALDLFGFLTGAEEDLVDARRELFAGAAHDYDVRRDLADNIPEDKLRQSPSDVTATGADWVSLLEG